MPQFTPPKAIGKLDNRLLDPFPVLAVGEIWLPQSPEGAIGAGLTATLYSFSNVRLGLTPKVLPRPNWRWSSGRIRFWWALVGALEGLFVPRAVVGLGVVGGRDCILPIALL